MEHSASDAYAEQIGQILDGEVDCILYLALALVLIQNGSMPGWVGVFILLRYLVPIMGAFLVAIFCSPALCASALR